MKIGDIIVRGPDTFRVVKVYADGDAEALRWIKKRHAWSKSPQTLYRESVTR